MEFNLTVCLLESSLRLSLGRSRNIEKYKSFDFYPKLDGEGPQNLNSNFGPKYNAEDSQSLDIDFGCPPPNLSSFISPFITDSIWHKPPNITNFAALRMNPKSTEKVYYGSDATGRPPGMLDNILGEHVTTECHDLSLNVLMSSQTERRTPDRDAIFGSRFLDNRV